MSPATEAPRPTLPPLERLDALTHGTVAGLLLLLAASVLVYACIVFAHQLWTFGIALWASGTNPVVGAERFEDPFIQGSLDFLSNVLFAVIVLELLRTILTYMRKRSLQAALGDFLVVGIISTVRKILLTGAHSSLVGEGVSEFTQEAIGTAVSVLAILLLIGGLWMLRQMHPSPPEMSEGKE